MLKYEIFMSYGIKGESALLKLQDLTRLPTPETVWYTADVTLSGTITVSLVSCFFLFQTWVRRQKEDATDALFDWDLFVRGSTHVESFPVSFTVLSFCNEGPLSLNGSCVLSCSVSSLSFPIHSLCCLNGQITLVNIHWKHLVLGKTVLNNLLSYHIFTSTSW